MSGPRRPGLFAAVGALALTAALSGLALAQASKAADSPAIDPSVRPGDDFYRYANGPWLSATPLPDGRPRFDTSAMLKDGTARRVRALVEA